MDTIAGFHDVTLFAPNVAELCDFYSSVGFELLTDEPDELAVFAVGSARLVIRAAAEQPSGAVGFSFVLPSIGPLQARLTEALLEFDGPTAQRPDMVGLSVEDPNGNRLTFLESSR